MFVGVIKRVNVTVASSTASYVFLVYCSFPLNSFQYYGFVYQAICTTSFLIFYIILYYSILLSKKITMWKYFVLLLFILLLNILVAQSGLTTDKPHVARLLLIGSWGNENTSRFTILLSLVLIS